MKPYREGVCQEIYGDFRNEFLIQELFLIKIPVSYLIIYDGLILGNDVKKLIVRPLIVVSSVILVVVITVAIQIKRRAWLIVREAQVRVDGRLNRAARVYRSRDGARLLVELELPDQTTISYIDETKKTEGLVYVSDIEIETPWFIVPLRDPPTNDPYLGADLSDLPDPNLKILSGGISYQSLIGHVDVTYVR